MSMSGARQNANPWVVRSKPNPSARLRLFCFPYAGGGAHVYHAWSRTLPAFVEVCGVQPPGRGSRVAERPFAEVGPLVRAAADALLPYLDIPFTFFGHSMGALIGFETAREYRRRGVPGPAQLFVSGRRAPQLPRTEPPTHELPEAEFIEELRRLNGTPQEVLDNPELMSLMIPLLRADFSVTATYEYTPEPPLDCRITAYGGLGDEEAGRAQMEPWREHTAAEFTLRMLPGDHFFLHSQQPLLLRALAQELERLARPAY